MQIRLPTFSIYGHDGQLSGVQLTELLTTEFRMYAIFDSHARHL